LVRGFERLKLAADYARKHATRRDLESHRSRMAGPCRFPYARKTCIIDQCDPAKVEADGPRAVRDLALDSLGRHVACLFNQRTIEPDGYATGAPLNVHLELHDLRIPVRSGCRNHNV